MKAYFIRLLSYDHHTNKILLDAINAAGNPKKPVQLMAHLLAAQQIWLARCKGDPTAVRVLWPDSKAETLKPLIDDNYYQWSAFIETLNTDDFDKVIQYKDLKGNSHENKLSDILGHLLNHGTHHRAQIGQQLKFNGTEQLPPTDYILYLRQLK